MILRAAGIILVAIVAVVGVIAFWHRTEFSSGLVALGNLLALVVFGIERFSKKKSDAPLFAVQFEDLRVDDRPVQYEEGDLAFAADFQLTNHGDAVADVEAVDGGRFSIQVRGPRNLPTGASTIISIFPYAPTADVPFKIRYRDKHEIESVMCMFKAKPISLTIKA